jgi:hypothetical protein
MAQKEVLALYPDDPTGGEGRAKEAQTGVDTYLMSEDLEVLGDVTVTDEVYGAGWNAAVTVPTKNALYDKLAALDAVDATLSTQVLDIVRAAEALPAGQDIGIVGTGQSNLNQANAYSIVTPPTAGPIITAIKDWSTVSAVGLGDNVWRNSDPDEERTFQLLENNSFDIDPSDKADWTYNTGRFSWATGTLTAASSGTGDSILQQVTTTLGRWYSVAYTINPSAGEVSIEIDGVAVGTAISATGAATYWISFEGTGTTSDVELVVSDAFTGTVSAISLQPKALVGYPCKGATYGPIGHIGYACAALVATLSGRNVRTLWVSRSGTDIDDKEFGWTWDSREFNTASILNEEATAARIAWRAEGGDQAAGDWNYGLFVQGENDAGMNSATYGRYLSDFLIYCYQSTRYGWATENVLHWLLFRFNKGLEEDGGNTWHGHEIAAERAGADKVIGVVDTDGAITIDGLHYYGASADALGEKAAREFQLHNAPHVLKDSAIRFRPKDVEVEDYWRTTLPFNTAATAMPALFAWNTDIADASATELRLSNALYTVGGVFEQPYLKGLQDFGSGDWIQFSKTSDPTGVYKRYTLLSAPSIIGVNANDLFNYMQWDCIEAATLGTFVNLDACTISASKRQWDGVAGIAHSDLFLESATIAAGAEDVTTTVTSYSQKRMLSGDADGTAVRTVKFAPLFNTVIGTASGVITYSGAMPDDTTSAFSGSLYVTNTSDVVNWYSMKGILVDTGGTLVLQWSDVATIRAGFTADNTPTISISLNKLVITGFGVGTATHTFVFEAEVNYELN